MVGNGWGSSTLLSYESNVLISREENTPKNATTLSGLNHLGLTVGGSSVVDEFASVVDTLFGDVVVSFAFGSGFTSISWFNFDKVALRPMPNPTNPRTKQNITNTIIVFVYF